MYEVIINGVNSNTLNGLQILSLPPITKPKMRTQISTIDGRAGDIVTRLGYEAYNKKIKILLHDNYNFDAIENFFNSSGTIVFSNESNRLYQFETLDAIDFQRAVQFKTAEVTFHVQPYKLLYPAESRTITTSSTTITNAGNTVSAPRLRVNGSGTVTISIDGNTAFVITMPGAGWIVIDAAQMNAYSGENLANRSVTGAYDNIFLSPGSHTLSRSGGSVSSMVIENYSRWI